MTKNISVFLLKKHETVYGYSDYDEPEAGRKFKVSAFSKGTGQVRNNNTKYEIWVEVQYYFGYNHFGIDEFSFAFTEGCRDWQFVCGNFGTRTEALVASVTVYCVYSCQPSGTPVTGTYGYNDASWGDLLTSYNGVSITYDGIGNPLSYYNGSSYTFSWQNGRQLATAVKGSQSLSFAYNDEGIRTRKTVNEHYRKSLLFH